MHKRWRSSVTIIISIFLLWLAAAPAQAHPPPQASAATDLSPTPVTNCTPVASSSNQIILSEGFEGVWPPAGGAWSVAGNPTWDDDDFKPRTGGWSAWVANGGTLGIDPATNNYPNNMSAWMTYGPFALTRTTGTRLRFYYWNKSELNYDFLHWRVSLDGVNANSYGSRTSGDSGGWQQMVMDLTQVPTLGNVVGQPCVWIHIGFTSDNISTDQGTFVDDIVLEQVPWGAYYAPNPIAVSGLLTLTDNNDANSPLLQSLRAQGGLLGLDSSGRLRGAYANLYTGGSFSGCDTGIGRGLAYSLSGVFVYTRDHNAFEEVVAYRTVDAMQRYIQSLDPTFDNIANTSIPIHAHCFVGDGLASAAGGVIRLGDGGVDGGEDGETVAHEYGHIIQASQIAGWHDGTSDPDEQGAVGEGFSDYWAASFFADQSATADLRACMSEWDAAGFVQPYPPCIRRVDEDFHYPEDYNYGQYHYSGQIWSATLWEIRNSLGGVTTDHLVLQSHRSLRFDSRFGEAAEALITADTELYSGAHRTTLATVLKGRGLFDQYEWDDEPGWATAIIPNGDSQTHRFHSKFDADWVKFTATPFDPNFRQVYQITAFNLWEGVDTYIELYASDQTTLLASNADCAPGQPASCLNFAAPATGTYYLKIISQIQDPNHTGLNKYYEIGITTLAQPYVVHLPLSANTLTTR